MGQFPQLNQEDLDALDVAMSELLGKSEANVALLVEKAGYLIHQCGNQEAMDATTFATVGSMKYYAAPAARAIGERIHLAAARAPGAGLDLADLDPADVQALFRKA